MNTRNIWMWIAIVAVAVLLLNLTGIFTPSLIGKWKSDLGTGWKIYYADDTVDTFMPQSITGQTIYSPPGTTVPVEAFGVAVYGRVYYTQRMTDLWAKGRLEVILKTPDGTTYGYSPVRTNWEVLTGAPRDHYVIDGYWCHTNFCNLGGNLVPGSGQVFTLLGEQRISTTSIEQLIKDAGLPSGNYELIGRATVDIEAKFEDGLKDRKQGVGESVIEFTYQGGSILSFNVRVLWSTTT